MVEVKTSSILQEKPVGKNIPATQIEKKIFNFKPGVKDSLEKFKPQKNKILKEDFKLKVTTLTGTSISEQRAKRKFQLNWDKNGDFGEKRSISSEIALPPQIIFPGSTNKNPAEQMEMAVELENQVTNNIDGVKVLIAKVADAVELFNNSSAEDGYDEILKQTSARCVEESPVINNLSTENKYGVTVGRMNDKREILLTNMDAGKPSTTVGEIFMVVPADLPRKDVAK